MLHRNINKCPDYKYKHVKVPLGLFMLCYRPEATLPGARKLRPMKPLPSENISHARILLSTGRHLPIQCDSQLAYNSLSYSDPTGITSPIKCCTALPVLRSLTTVLYTQSTPDFLVSSYIFSAPADDKTRTSSILPRTCCSRVCELVDAHIPSLAVNLGFFLDHLIVVTLEPVF
jgi:hypothetical protein